MAEQHRVESRIGIIGSVAEDVDFSTVVDNAVEQGLIERRRMPIIRCFAGYVAFREDFAKVAAVQGVTSLEYDRPVYAQLDNSTE